MNKTLCKRKTFPTQELRQRATKYCCWEMFIVWAVYASLHATRPAPLIPCPLLLTSVERADSPRLLYVNRMRLLNSTSTGAFALSCYFCSENDQGPYRNDATLKEFVQIGYIMNNSVLAGRSAVGLTVPPHRGSRGMWREVRVKGQATHCPTDAGHRILLL
jgi:hypothetical protein